MPNILLCLDKPEIELILTLAAEAAKNSPLMADTELVRRKNELEAKLLLTLERISV